MSVTINGDTGIDKITDGSVVNADIGANEITQDKVASGFPLGKRNLIINGDMRIAQRGTSASGITTGTSYHTADRLAMQIGTAGTWTQSQDTDVPSGQGFSNSCKWQCTTANASLSTGSVFNILHRIEGQNLQYLKKGTANAETVTLSFWIKSNKTGAYQVNLNDQDNTRIIGSTYTISNANTWEKKTLTFAGDTTGAFDNDNNQSLQLEWWFVAGTDFTSGTIPTSWTSKINADRAAGQTVNLADSTANYINITGLQLEIGDSASTFEFMPYDMELQRCFRYFEKSDGAVNGSSGSTITGRCNWVFKVKKRATPTITEGGGSAKTGVEVTSTDLYGINRASGNQPVIGSGSTADSEL